MEEQETMTGHGVSELYFEQSSMWGSDDRAFEPRSFPREKLLKDDLQSGKYGGAWMLFCNGD